MRWQSLSLRRHDPIQAQRGTVLQHCQQYLSLLVGDPSVLRSISGTIEWRSTRLICLVAPRATRLLVSWYRVSHRSCWRSSCLQACAKVQLHISAHAVTLPDFDFVPPTSSRERENRPSLLAALVLAAVCVAIFLASAVERRSRI